MWCLCAGRPLPDMYFIYTHYSLHTTWLAVNVSLQTHVCTHTRAYSQLLLCTYLFSALIENSIKYYFYNITYWKIFMITSCYLWLYEKVKKKNLLLYSYHILFFYFYIKIRNKKSKYIVMITVKSIFCKSIYIDCLW